MPLSLPVCSRYVLLGAWWVRAGLGYGGMPPWRREGEDPAAAAGEVSYRRDLEYRRRCVPRLTCENMKDGGQSGGRLTGKVSSHRSMYTCVHAPVLRTAGRHGWVRTEEACPRSSGRGWVGTVAALRECVW
jgi:hypothetical protein